MPLYSIPPIERGLVKRRGSSRLGTSASSRASVGFRTPTSQPIRQKLPLYPHMSPSIHDVKVTRTPNGATWEFPYGEFEAMIENGEVHVEVKIGRFVDALIVKI